VFLQVIDPFESSDSSCWPDENTRQLLIEECRESSAGPFLLVNKPHILRHDWMTHIKTYGNTDNLSAEQALEAALKDYQHSQSKLILEGF